MGLVDTVNNKRLPSAIEYVHEKITLVYVALHLIEKRADRPDGAGREYHSRMKAANDALDLAAENIRAVLDMFDEDEYDDDTQE